MGLGGASLWLQRFTERLDAFRRTRPDRTRVVALELLLKLVRNIVNSPQEPKFKRIKADNPRIRADLLAPGVGEDIEALMTLLGFESTLESDGVRVFLLRDAAFD